MDRRTFLKTTGVTAGAGAIGFGVASHGMGHDVVTAEELDGEVELLTDEYGVSHVYADSLYGVGYGQGYAQARDRLFQLDLLRSIGRGELSKIIGPGELSEDVSSKRDLYTAEEIETQWENAAPDTREMIHGYTAGVNDQMARLKARGELPGEYTLLARRPHEWKPTDSVAAITYMIGRFGVSAGAGLSNFRTVEELFNRVAGESENHPDRFDSRSEAWEAYGDLNTVEIPDEHYGSIRADELPQQAGATPTGERTLSFDDVPEEQLELLNLLGGGQDWSVEESAFDGLRDVFSVSGGMFSGVGFGSNAIIVDGDHTETGKPMLGGGPQMGLFKPPVIHEIGLHGPEFDVVGVGVVGAPGIVVGRTPQFAWTVTTSGDPMTERVAVELDPDDHSRYRWDGAFHEFETERHVHEPNLWAGLIEGNLETEQIEQEVAYVEQEGTRMPVIDYHPDEDMAIVHRVATRMNELEGAFHWADLGRATNQAEFEETLAEFPFGFNFHYVDDDGIAYYRTGKLPKRATESDPRFPTPERYHEWDGFHEGIIVKETDPDRGYVVNWNNGAAPGWRNGSDEFDWDGPHRTEIMDRLTREAIVRTSDAHSLADIEGLELPAEIRGNLSLAAVEAIIEECSVEQPFAPRLVPHLVSVARDSNDEQLTAIADELERWAESVDLERWAGPETLSRWAETVYSFRPGDDGRYPNGGMAIFEQVSHELVALVFEESIGSRAPTLDFDPTGGGFAGSDHAADHGSSAGIGLIIDALEGADRLSFDWLGHAGTTQSDCLKAALGRAADELESTYESADPSDWRMNSRESEFGSLGGTGSEFVPMTNRASYQQSIAIGQGEGSERDLAKSLLPPANTGHVNTWELIAVQFGSEPDRLTTQLDLYAEFAYLPQPITREGVEARATEARTID